MDVTNIFGLDTLFATATSWSILDLSHMVQNQITLDLMKLYQKHVLKVVEMHKKQKIGDLVLLHLCSTLQNMTVVPRKVDSYSLCTVQV